MAAYGSDLEAFGRFLAKARIDAAKASRADLGRYLTELRGRGLSARSASRALSAVRGFYGFAAAHLSFREDPTADMTNPKIGLALPKSLSEGDVESLLDAPDTATPLGLRDRAMLELLYASGLRVSEIVNLPRDAVDMEAGILRVSGKGRQGAPGSVRQVGRALGRALPRVGPPGARREALAEALPLRARRRDDAPAVLAAHRGVRPRRRRSAPASRRTPCATPSRRTCSSTARTCGPSR